MNFTSDIKKEIIARGLGKKGELALNRAGLSAFLRTSGELGFLGGTPNFFLVSETENVAEFFMRVFFETFGTELSVTHATMDRMSGRDKLVLQSPSSNAREVLKELGLLKRGEKQLKEGIAKSLVKGEKEKIAYIKGAFLGGGSCILPSANRAGYHLEIVFFEKQTAKDFCDLLVELELFAKLTQRKETYVAYIKSKEAISDFLAIVGATSSLNKFVAISEKREESNRNNRAQNCVSGNADKAAIAAVKQVVALQKIEKATNFKGLSEELSSLAKARLKHPAVSLRELAQILNVSKSCLNHRMRRLMEIAEEL